jgi:Mg2+ and Co2+ transporter CorA
MQSSINDIKRQLDGAAQRTDLTKLASDVDKLREEMHTAFDSAENQFYSRVVIDERAQRVNDHFILIEKRLDAIEKQHQSDEENAQHNRFQLGNNAVFWTLSGIGIMLTVILVILGLLGHLTYHP